MYLFLAIGFIKSSDNTTSNNFRLSIRNSQTKTFETVYDGPVYFNKESKNELIKNSNCKIITVELDNSNKLPKNIQPESEKSSSKLINTKMNRIRLRYIRNLKNIQDIIKDSKILMNPPSMSNRVPKNLEFAYSYYLALLIKLTRKFEKIECFENSYLTDPEKLRTRLETLQGMLKFCKVNDYYQIRNEIMFICKNHVSEDSYTSSIIRIWELYFTKLLVNLKRLILKKNLLDNLILQLIVFV